MKNRNHRLYWSCRRGMLELDLILIPFLESQYASLNQQQQADFTELLAATDPELFSWLTGKDTPQETHLANMVRMIREYAHDPNRPR